MDEINNKISLNIGNEKFDTEEGSFIEKKVKRPRFFEKMDIPKENALGNEIISDIIIRDISPKETENEDFDKLIERLTGFEMTSSPSSEEREEVIEALIKYFNNPDRLNETDFRGNNAFHWAAKLHSFKAWLASRNILENQNLNKENTPNPLTKRNHFDKGNTPWELVHQSSNLDFIKDVLLDELNRNPNTTIIKDLINQYDKDINQYTDYKDKTEFVSKYIEHRGLLAGDETVIKKIINESHQTWKSKKETTATSVDVFLGSPDFKRFVKNYTFYTKEELDQAGYTREVLKQALSNKEYKVENNEVLANVLTYMRNLYQDWQEYSRTTLQFSLKIEYFMRTPTYLSIMQTILSGGNQEAIDYFCKVNKHGSLKDVLQNPYMDQKKVEACILAIFKQKDCHRAFETLGYQPKEVIELAKKYVFAITKSGALFNVISLFVNKCLYNAEQITTFLSLTDIYGNTPLHISAAHGHLTSDIKGLEDVGFSIKSIVAFLSVPDKCGYKPLELSLLNNYWSADIKGLKDRGFSTEAIVAFLSIPNKDGHPQLHAAAIKGDLAVDVIRLKDMGFSTKAITAFLSIPDKNGDTPLHLLAKNGQLAADIKKMNKGDFSTKAITAFLSIPDKNGDTPLHLSARKGQLAEEIEALTEIGFSIETIIKLLSIPNKNSRVPLHISATNRYLASDIKGLKEIGFPIEAIVAFLSIPSEDGKMPLHTAALHGYPLRSTIKVLKDVGFSREEVTKILSITDTDGKTPLFEKENDKELTEALQSAGLEESDIKPLYLQLK